MKKEVTCNNQKKKKVTCNNFIKASSSSGIILIDFRENKIKEN